MRKGLNPYSLSGQNELLKPLCIKGLLTTGGGKVKNGRCQLDEATTTVLRRTGGRKHHNHAPNVTRRENVVLTGRGQGPDRPRQTGRQTTTGTGYTPCGMCRQKISVDIVPGIWYLIHAGQGKREHQHHQHQRTPPPTPKTRPAEKDGIT